MSTCEDILGYMMMTCEDIYGCIWKDILLIFLGIFNEVVLTLQKRSWRRKGVFSEKLDKLSAHLERFANIVDLQWLEFTLRKVAGVV